MRERDRRAKIMEETYSRTGRLCIHICLGWLVYVDPILDNHVRVHRVNLSTVSHIQTPSLPFENLRFLLSRDHIVSGWVFTSSKGRRGGVHFLFMHGNL